MVSDPRKRKFVPPHSNKTSWEKVSGWYDKAVGSTGHYYHEKIVIPGVCKLLDFEGVEQPSLLDLACGQGILSRFIPKTVDYIGVDISPSLIESAKRQAVNKKHRFFVSDITKPLKIETHDFSHATIILALQNLQAGAEAIQNAARHLRKDGELLIVLNHPYYRIPRQSSWGVDKDKKIQYRRVDSYLSPMEIPIQAHPGKGAASEMTWSYHHPLSAYTRWLFDAGFLIAEIQEWCSDKTSEGGAAKMENKARLEFPLFMIIRALKTSFLKKRKMVG